MPATDRSPVTGFAFVLLAASMFGMLGPLSRFSYDAGMEPLGFVAWRGGIGLAAIIAFVAWRAARGSERLVRLGELDRRAKASLLVAALMGFAVGLFLFSAFDRVTVALALLGFYTYPVIVALASVALGREALDRTRVLALGLAVSGMVAVVASQLDPSASIRIDPIGLVLAFGAALSQAVYMLISRSEYRTVPASQSIIVVLGVTVICGVALAVVTGAGSQLAYPVTDPAVLPLLTFTGLFTAAVPSILFLLGIRIIGGMRAGIVMLFEPVVGVALAAWLLHEGLAPIQVLGGAAVLAAALLLQRSAARDPVVGDRVVAAPAIEAEAG